MKKLAKLFREGIKGDADPVMTAYDKDKPLTAFDHIALLHRYRNFPEILRDTDDEHYPQCRKRVLDALITQEESFAKFICSDTYLYQLVTIRRDKADIEKIVRHIQSNERCQDKLLCNFDHLHELSKHELFKPYIDQIVATALSVKRNHFNLIVGKNSVKKCLQYFPKFKKAMLDILANDAEMFENCMETEAPFFCAFAKEHKDHTRAFINHVCTNAKVFDKIIFHTKDISYFLEQFPEDETQDKLMGFVVADDERFKKKFPSFLYIYEFGEKHPKHLKKLLDKAFTMIPFVERNISATSELLELDKISKQHAEQAETMIIANSQWVLKIINTLNQVEKIFQYNGFNRLKIVFLPLFYQNEKNFSQFVANKKELEKMIEIFPQEKEKLRLYFELYIQKKTVSEIMQDPGFQDDTSQTELKSYQESTMAKTAKLDVKAAIKLSALSEIVKAGNEPGQGKSASPPKNLQ